ncbi:uncharacterized protein B4U80_06628 [Leptotrombidium deliense]|uniref:Pyrroline-5-carboxylate reductase 3 n=1 Tax=Leptotrombidium deliense TaxID=299467 RepID=A0A443RY43_9ACAR|nr:uncharacterized protein B4U80_06628 [Leptotrombidium deliense]
MELVIETVSEMERIGFIGAGNMCNALVTGLISSGYPVSSICVSAPSNRNLQRFANIGCSVTNNNSDLLPENQYECKIIFLCVKPTIINSCTRENPFICYNGKKSVIIISVLAGTTLNKLREAIICNHSSEKKCECISLYRTMPNVACTVGQGVFGLCTDKSCQSIDDRVVSLLRKLGVCEMVLESQMNAITGVAGSGIAFVYTLIQSMSDGGVKMGLPRNLSTCFAVQTFLGAAVMVEKTGKHPIALRDEVCSPGGTTIHGIHEIEKGAVPAAIMNAVEAATKRAQELSG